MQINPSDIGALLDRFRADRSRLEGLLAAIPPSRQLDAPHGERSARNLVAQLAAWLNEANDRIPRLLAGAPSVEYDVAAFDAAAAERVADWTPRQALGAFRRAADRFDVMIAESDPGELIESDEVVAWLRAAAGCLMDAHIAGLERLVARRSGGGPRAGAT